MELELVPASLSPITLYCDNSGAVAHSKEPRNHGKGKHVERKYHLIRNIVQRGDVIITKIVTIDNLADPFTKALPQKVFDRHLDSLGLSVVLMGYECKWEFVGIVPSNHYCMLKTFDIIYIYMNSLHFIMCVS